ncbi:MAG TPA: thioredoxin domain-containing protein [Gemmatimonadaceae bacterium]|nr:thioredoxin domain-containing protein [Gemmatimonadaceae bacterium]
MNQKRNAPSKTTKSGNRSFVTGIVVLGLIGAAVIGVVVSRSKGAAAVVLDPNAPLPEAKGPVTGDPSALVEMTEFGDFECPVCGRFATITEPDVRTRLVKTGLIRFRFIDFPLINQHLSTLTAHNAAACANVQGKFWDMHDRIYIGQSEWSTFANGRDMNAPKIMKRYAKELGLDTKAFNTCLDNHEQEPQVRANLKEGERLGVNQTPTFYIGKRLVVGLQPYDAIKATVDSAIADAKKAAPAGKALGDTALKSKGN